MMHIRQATEEDAAQVADIYNWYISNTTVTFETEVISVLEMRRRIKEKIETYDWIVGEYKQNIVGYAYYDSFKARTAYCQTIETTIYLTQESVGKGFGSLLYERLIESAKSHDFRELIGLIALPNLPSTALHQKMGFEEVGVLKKVGYKFDRYIDVGIWQKSL